MPTQNADDAVRVIEPRFTAPAPLAGADPIDPPVVDLTSEYDVIEELGRGSSAVVYRARDRALDREVAIKVAYHVRPAGPLDAQLRAAERPVRESDEPVARLMREARLVARLQHPNVVDVFAVRRLADGGVALVMQLVHGRTLRAALREQGPLAPADVERILGDVARALAAAHERGVVHRDVKPENVFLDDATGRTLLSDFGIARSADADLRLTQTGVALGTPAYMSPEQIDGGATDGRSDLYSLGMLAWELLTGRRPWDGEKLFALLSKQKHERLPPIEVVRPADREAVPPALQYAVERLSAKDPNARFASAAALLAYLDGAAAPDDYGRWEAEHRRRVAGYASRATAVPLDADVETDTMRVPCPAPAVPVAPVALVAPAADAPAAAGAPRRRIAIALVVSLLATGAVAPLARLRVGHPPAVGADAAGERAHAAPRTAEPPASPRRRSSSAAARDVRGDTTTARPRIATPTLRERVAAIVHGATPAAFEAAPASAAAVAPTADTTRPPHPVAMVGTWYFGDRRSTYGDSITLVLRPDATALMIERRFRIAERGGLRTNGVPRKGRWEVRYAAFPRRLANELCTEWRTPVKLWTCAPFALDTLPTDRMLRFGGRYWRSSPLAGRSPAKRRHAARR